MAEPLMSSPPLEIFGLLGLDSTYYGVGHTPCCHLYGNRIKAEIQVRNPIGSQKKVQL